MKRRGDRRAPSSSDDDGPPTVVTTLKGGLGNQLFQYAAGLALARELAGTVSFHSSASTDVELEEALGIAIDETAPDTARSVGALASSSRTRAVFDGSQRRWQRVRGQLVQVRQHANDAFALRPSDLLPGNAERVLLDGYFQHPTWFDVSLPDVAARLGERLTGLAGSSLGSAATVISFRRGDYLRLGWDLSLDYYEQALRCIPESDGPVWVVGDDELVVEFVAPWLRERGRLVSPPPDIGARRLIRDLALLCAADHVVMSNSTFCWWGVVAGDAVRPQVARTIVAPAHWVPRPGSDALVRPNWYALD